MFFMIILYISVLVVLTVTIWWCCYTSTEFWKLCLKIPGPKPFPIIGNIMDILGPKEKLLHNFLELTAKYSPMCRFFLGNTCFVLLHDVDDVNIVLRSEKTRSRFVAFDILERFLGKSLLSARGDDWKKYRRLINPALKGSALKSYVGIFNEKSEILVSILERKCNEVFDIHDVIQAMTLDTSIQVATGADMKIQEGNKTEIISLLNQGKRYIYKCLVNPIYWFKPVYNNSEIHKFAVRATETLYKCIIPEGINLDFCGSEETIKQSKEDTGHQFGIVHHIIDNMRPTCFLTKNDLMVQLLVLEAAAADTTALALSNCLKLLGFYKEVQDNVVKEIYEIFSDDICRAAEYEDLQKMVYTEQFIKETLRLFSSAYLNGRRADEDIVVGGYILPAGTNILISPYLIHRNPKHYPDPLKFDPERFSPHNAKNRNPRSFIPFAVGPRNCIGNQYAMLVLKTALCHILRCFEILQYDNADMIAEVNMEIALTMKHGHKICLKKRKQYEV